MSTATEITRLQAARNAIRDKLVELGLAASTAKLDALAAAIGGIENRGAVSKTLDTRLGNTAYTIPKGYHGGSGGVEIIPEAKTATPAAAAQTVTSSPGRVLSSVTVEAVPPAFGDTSDATGAASDILSGKVLYGKNSQGGAVRLSGTMPNMGAVSATFDGLTASVYTIPDGYHNGSGTVSLTNDIETALAAI